MWISDLAQLACQGRLKLVGVAPTVLLTVFISACTQLPQPPSDEAVPPSAGYAPWTAVGKLAVVEGNQSNTVNFRWQRRSLTQDTITLSGPVGLSPTRIERTESELVWIDNGRARSLDELALSPTALALTDSLPLTDLGDWLLGATQPSAPWQLTVTRWTEAQGYRVPARLNVEREGLALRVAISRWTLEDAAL